MIMSYYEFNFKKYFDLDIEKKFSSEQFISAPKRIALIIGNSNYQQVDKLENPSRDATLITDAFRKVGFDEVTYG